MSDTKPPDDREIRNGYGLASRDWLIESLVRPFHRSDIRVRSDEHAALLADALLVQGERNAEAAFYYAQEHGLFVEGSNVGWLTRQGELLGCSYATHERLLKVLGVATRGAERCGWARVARGKLRCAYRLSPQQKKALRDLPEAIWDRREDLLKPVWTEPSRLERIDLAVEGVRESLPYGAHFLYDVEGEAEDVHIVVNRIRETYGVSVRAIEERIQAVGERLEVAVHLPGQAAVASPTPAA